MSDVGARARELLAGPEAAPARAALADARAAGVEPDPRAFYRLLGRHRLLAASWPGGYGGRDAHPAEATEVVDAMIDAAVPEVLHTLSVQICGAFLLTAGTDAQRASVLPALAAGARFATVLYSEPEAGSDLSTLTTRAEPVDGGWRVTGRKVYSVKTAFADLGLLVARTSDESSQYAGITLFLVPLWADGVHIGHLPGLADEAFADVRLDGVLLPSEAVVGPVGGAWPLVTEALALERTGVDYVAKADAWLRWSDVDGEAAGRLRVRTAAGRSLSRRCVDQLAGGRVDPVLAAVTKHWCSEVARDTAWVCGTERVWTGDPLEAAYREAPGLTLSAGTSEMMLELVGGSGLPIPDGEPPGDEEPLARALRRAVRAVATSYDERDEGAVWWKELAGLGFFGLAAPTEVGGAGLGAHAAVLACEELGRERHDAGVLDTLTALDALLAAGDERAAAVVAGQWRAALVQTGRPVPAGDLDGLLLLDGDRLSLLDPARAEVTTRATAAGPAATVRVPDTAAATPLGPAGSVLAAGRVRRAAWLTGLGVGALAHTVLRARGRRQFGRVLLDNQAVAFRLAELSVRYEALRALLADLARAVDAGTLRPELAAGALAEAGEFAAAASRDAVQLHGAFGMTDASPVQAYYRSVPVALAADEPPAALFARCGRRP